MKKLTQAQERVLKEAKDTIDRARASIDYVDYEYNKPYSGYKDTRYYRTFEEAKAAIIERDNKSDNHYSKLYEEYRTGKALVTSNTKTLKALEALGLIKIINEGGSYPDLIEVIGY